MSAPYSEFCATAKSEQGWCPNYGNDKKFNSKAAGLRHLARSADRHFGDHVTPTQEHLYKEILFYPKTATVTGVSL